MSYLPSNYRNMSLVQGSVRSLNQTVRQATIVRQAKCISRSYNKNEKSLILGIEELEIQLRIPENRVMRFGTESITMVEYFKRVVENKDLLDFILDPRFSPQIAYFWIHIEYVAIISVVNHLMLQALMGQGQTMEERTTEPAA